MTPRTHSARRGMIITTAAPIVLIAFLIYDALHTTWDIPRQIGFTLALAFLVLLTIARIQLGLNFSITPQARELVTTGLYSKLRHPVYVFGVLGISGFFIYLHQYWALLAMVIVVPMQIMRARAEDRVLETTFGDQYRAYRAKTWF